MYPFVTIDDFWIIIPTLVRNQYIMRPFKNSGVVVMSRICEVTGKKPMSGNHVSHANNRTRRRFLPNLQHRKFWVESEKRWINLRLSNAALRTIDKNGIDAVLAKMRARGNSV